MRLDGMEFSGHRPAGRGHAHFWERAMSRRNLMQTAGLAGAALAGTRLLRTLPAGAADMASGADPRPIPGGLTVNGHGYHVYTPGRSNPADPSSPLNEPSTITDFDGIVAITQTQGTGTEYQGDTAVPMAWDSDMRFMAGRYRGMDGRIREAAFGFI